MNIAKVFLGWALGEEVSTCGLTSEFRFSLGTPFERGVFSDLMHAVSYSHVLNIKPHEL